MTTRREHRPGWIFTATAVAALATVLTVAGAPSPASASVPRTAQRWASLMFHSLTPTPQYVQLRKTLAAQRASLVTWSERIGTGRTAHAAAQSALTTAITADEATRTQYAIAREALASARNRLTLASQQRPRNAAAVAAAKTVVTATAKTTAARRGQAGRAAAALKAAQTASRTATTRLDGAIAAWQRTSAAIRTNQQRLIELDKSAELAGQAAAISRNVVTDVRSRFVVADTTSVNGVTVHKSVSFAFRRMLADAKADGVVLSGGGFRTKQRQIELRKINGCPDVWKAPASSCRVPTAIPGQSLHELGLAVDITSGGRSLTANSAGFRWLSANASKYGYVNLPSEPWHWSITGG
ncbi:D-alanyl-D-alanine carboxypeptidase family protein [Actinoplanes sp. NPDC051346]|uniref:D-alanyl-D-alanine carboxypeptidase family protein n=1 Tax=Actinoplanes sp. NPDC051346 TaxID=3155048 RepID=UPI003432620F